jgi:A/G-specific adenine glycosylase
VLASWSGLGYYRRARQMHAAARQIAATGFPRTPEGLRALPGIGDYTAAAVASIAFGVATPVVDGNVERVVGRLLALDGDPKTAGMRAKLRDAAAALLDPGRPGDSNQALMELGATVCLPQRPRCLACPVTEGCAALATGDPERFPPPRRRRATTAVKLLVALVEEEGRALLFRRPEGSTLLAGTWELPWIELNGGPDGAEELRSYAAAALAVRYGGAWQIGTALATVRHGITHRAIEARVVAARLSGTGVVEEGMEAGWFSAEERQALPLSSLVGKVIRAAAEVSAPVTAPGAGRRPRRRRRA